MPFGPIFPTVAGPIYLTVPGPTYLTVLGPIFITMPFGHIFPTVTPGPIFLTVPPGPIFLTVPMSLLISMDRPLYAHTIIRAVVGPVSLLLFEEMRFPGHQKSLLFPPHTHSGTNINL